MVIGHITPAGANIFADLGLPGAQNLKIRSTLMIAIERIIDERGLTRAKAARLFGVTVTRIRELERGKIDTFTIAALIDMLAHAGIEVEVRVSEPA